VILPCLRVSVFNPVGQWGQLKLQQFVGSTERLTGKDGKTLRFNTYEMKYENSLLAKFKTRLKVIFLIIEKISLDILS